MNKKEYRTAMDEFKRIRHARNPDVFETQKASDLHKGIMKYLSDETDKHYRIARILSRIAIIFSAVTLVLTLIRLLN